MTELVQKAIQEIEKLSETEQDILAVRILEMIESEEYLDDDDESDVAEILKDIVNEDGSINFDKLHDTSIEITLDELYKEN